jgi:EAL domain-containing protein (putative c-di-GMP-specific phosphodiesterase class I)
MRCDYLQGYLFSKPIPVAELEAMVKARSPLGT